MYFLFEDEAFRWYLNGENKYPLLFG